MTNHQEIRYNNRLIEYLNQVNFSLYIFESIVMIFSTFLVILVATNLKVEFSFVCKMMA